MIKRICIILFVLTLLTYTNVFATQNNIMLNNTTDESLLNNNDIITQKNNVNIIQKKQVTNGEPLPENVLYIELKDGIVIAELFPELAPMHVQRIKILTKDGFYDNVKFHRVIKGFMAQTGDPTGTGKGGSRLGKLYAEFNNEHHVRGTLSMARASDPNSANSQFFIVTGDFFPELDGQYTIFGRVLDGMEYVDKIKIGNTENNGMVDNPDEMIKVITGDMLNDKSISQIKEEIKIVNKVQEDRVKDEPSYKKKSVLDLLVQTKDVIPNADNIESVSQSNNNAKNTFNNTQNLNNGIVTVNESQNNSTNNVVIDISNTQNSNNTPQMPTDTINSINSQTPELPDSFEMPSVPNLPDMNNVIIEQNTGTVQEKQNSDPFTDLNDLGLELPSPYQP